MITITQIIFVLVTAGAIGIGYYHEYSGGNWGIFGQSCHRRFANPFKYMATKTPYLSDHLEATAALGDPFKTYHGGVCEPQMTWHLVRHGTRNPSDKVISRMKGLLPDLQEKTVEGHAQGRGKLCHEELNGLINWKSYPLPEESNEKILVSSGQKELLGISRRFKQMYPKVYEDNYHNDTFKFQFTKTQRAEASAQHYTKGIFDEEYLRNIYFPTAEHAHPVLRFYKFCKKWKTEVDKNPVAYSERVKFETSSIYVEMMRKLEGRLGLEKPLTPEQVEIMYLTCAFESAWDPSNPSPWCDLFDEYDFQILEYRQDIEYYWIDGYGYKLTYQIACPTIEDIVQKISSKVEDPSSPSVVAYFTHSGTLLKVIARLGLFNDSVPLLGNNFDHHRYSRKWRTSVIDPFATNLAFVLYKCSSSNYKVGLLFKEKPISQPLCDGKYLCPLDEFKASMIPLYENCDLTRLCEL